MKFPIKPRDLLLVLFAAGCSFAPASQYEPWVATANERCLKHPIGNPARLDEHAATVWQRKIPNTHVERDGKWFVICEDSDSEGKVFYILPHDE